MTTTPEFIALQRAVAGRYSLDRELGRGGMGVVFLARDVALDRRVAIKLLPPDLAADEIVRKRFLREARTAAGLSHPNVVQIHSVEEHGDLVFFVMAFVDGETLGARVRRDGPMRASDVMRVTQEVAWALAHAHARGVIHRDVKPDNVLIDRESDRALVTDFGIAREIQAADTPPSGPVLGTPQYMSPEQAAGEPVDPRSDLYSLGVTSFFAATGRLPFEANSVAGYLVKLANDRPPKLGPLAPRLPTRFADLIDKCLAKDAGMRPSTADGLASEIDSARGALVRVPVPLERFRREADGVGGDVATFLGGALGSATVFEILRAAEGDFLGILFGIEMVFITVFLGLSVARATQLFSQARELLKRGYTHHALRAGLELAERRDLEDEELEPKTSRAAPWLTAGAGVTITALGVGAGIIVESDVAVILSLASAVGGPMLTIRRLWSQLGAPKWWRRLLKGRLGRWVFRVGSIGLPDRPEALPDQGERTEVVLGGVAEQLFTALPPDQRDKLGNVPALIAKLEADALALRKSGETPEAMERLSATVAALETLRLDLLRLHAGNVTLDELTQDIEAADQVRREIDRHLEAAREVEDLSSE
ncbi:MAG: serine/threonine protein kinase [Gemmatimonadota bacterium]|nr:MAG: serine/threonine protein kinase [Gemmatimonadota bacterium]